MFDDETGLRIFLWDTAVQLSFTEKVRILLTTQLSTESNTRHCFIWNSGFKTVDYVQPKMTECDLMLPQFHSLRVTRIQSWSTVCQFEFPSPRLVSIGQRFYENPHTNLFYYRHYCLRTWLYGMEYSWFKFVHGWLVLIWMLFLNTEINREKTQHVHCTNSYTSKENVF